MPACCPRSRHRAQRESLPHGRAAFQSRCQASRPDAFRDALILDKFRPEVLELGRIRLGKSRPRIVEAVVADLGEVHNLLFGLVKGKLCRGERFVV